MTTPPQIYVGPDTASGRTLSEISQPAPNQLRFALSDGMVVDVTLPANRQYVARGPFQPLTLYGAGDLVTYGGRLYSATVEFTSGAVFAAADWTLSVDKGADGKSLNNRGAFAGNTAYAQGDIVSYQGRVYSANAVFTSNSTFQAGNWTLLLDKGADGVSFANKGAFAPATPYGVGDVVTYQGRVYSAPTGFTSGGSFNAANWTLMVDKGADGLNGTSFNNKGAFAATSYALGDLVTYQGRVYSAKAAFTASAGFNSSDWTLMVDKGADGLNGTSIVNRGAFTGGTTYAAGDLVTYQGQLYSANSAFTAGGGFAAGNWTLTVSKGIDGVNGTSFANKGAFAGSTVYALGDVVTYQGRVYSAKAGFTSAGAFSLSDWTLMVDKGTDGTNGLNGTSIIHRGAFAAATVYAQGDVMTYQGRAYSAKVAFTSGGAYSAADWNLLVDKGTDGTNGTSVVNRGAWAAATVYAAGDLVTYQNQLYSANAAFTSGGAFVAGNWTLTVAKGTDGVNGSSIVNRGAWAASTVYAAGDLVTYQGQLYSANAAFTSGASFVPANWTLTVAKGADSTVAGPTGPNPLIVTGLTGGTLGNLVIRLGATSTCIDAHPSMITELRTQPLYFLALDGTYYRSGANVPGFSNLTMGQAVALSGKTTSGGRNWTTFDLTTGIPTLLDYTGTQMYVQVGFVGSATTIEFDAPMGARISDGTPGTSVFDNFDGYGNSSAGAPAGFTAVWGQQWAADNGSNGLSLQPDTSGYLMQESIATAARHMVVRKDKPSVLDGQTYGVWQMFGIATGNVNFIVQAGARVAGAAGTETSVNLEMNSFDSMLKLTTYKAGTAATITTVPFVVDVTKRYAWAFDFKGTRLLGKVWDTAGAEPAAWMIEGYTDLLTTGYMGIGARTSFFNVYGMGLTAGAGSAPRA